MTFDWPQIRKGHLIIQSNRNIPWKIENRGKNFIASKMLGGYKKVVIQNK